MPIVVFDPDQLEEALRLGPPSSRSTRAKLLASLDNFLVQIVCQSLDIHGSQRPRPGDPVAIPEHPDIRILGACGAAVVGEMSGSALLEGLGYFKRFGLRYRISSGIRFRAVASPSPSALRLQLQGLSRSAGATGIGTMSTQKSARAIGERSVIGVADSGVDPSRAKVSVRGFAAFDPRSGRQVNNRARDYSPVLHGTNVCALAADAEMGVSPGTPLLVAAVLTELEGQRSVGTEEQVAAGLNWLTRAGAQVLNLSFGASGASAAWYDIIDMLRRLGVPTVAAIGNEPDNPLFPARFDHTIGVGALDNDDRPAGFSASGLAADRRGRTLGRPKPDLYLPGVDLSSPARTDLISGTSYAAPLCAGVVSLFGVAVPPLETGGNGCLRRLRRLLEHNPELASATMQPAGGASASAATISPSHSLKPGGASMPSNSIVAGSVEVLPDTTGFRIEDDNGVLVGVLLNTASGTDWLMDTANLWPSGPLFLTPIPDAGSLEFPGSTTTFNAADSFQDSPTQGNPTLDAAKTSRYLIKSGGLVLAVVAVNAAGTTPAARFVDEYGHPALDGRLPHVGGRRYLPSATLRMVSRNQHFTPNWGSRRDT